MKNRNDVEDRTGLHSPQRALVTLAICFSILWSNHGFALDEYPENPGGNLGARAQISGFENTDVPEGGPAIPQISSPCSQCSSVLLGAHTTGPRSSGPNGQGQGL